jgi:endonuclease-3
MRIYLVNEKIAFALATMESMFPNAKAELTHSSAYELTCAVLLSAQATDVSVNKVTPALFHAYPDVFALSKANVNDVEALIKTIGLYKNKAKALVSMAQKVVNQYQGEIPSTKKALLTLDGVGIKTANVILSVWFHVPAIAVDTHVDRVSKRLGFAKESDSVIDVERKLKRKIDREDWSKAHHLMIFFGRYHCKAINPMCTQCPLSSQCLYYKRKK